MATVTRENTPRFTLVLSQDEAEALQDVLYRIGGSTSCSRRRHTDAISDALDDVGVDPTGGDDLRGEFVFREEC